MKDEVKATLAATAVAQLCLFRPMRLVCIALLVAAAMSGCAQIQGVFRNSDPLPARISLRDRTGASYNEFTLAPGEIRQSPLFPGSITLAERGKHIDDVHVVFWHIREHYS